MLSTIVAHEGKPHSKLLSRRALWDTLKPQVSAVSLPYHCITIQQSMAMHVWYSIVLQQVVHIAYYEFCMVILFVYIDPNLKCIVIDLYQYCHEFHWLNIQTNRTINMDPLGLNIEHE